MSQKQFSYIALENYACQLLKIEGLELEKAQIVANTLVAADLMGHTTHGIRLLPSYLKSLADGGMTKAGQPAVVKDRGSALTWDGNYLPGPWLIHQAIDAGLQRLDQHPVVTLVIRKSHHTACLATYPERVSRLGKLLLLTCSDPESKMVAPYGGIDPVLGSNPIAAGIPVAENPLVFDISTSETAGGAIQLAAAEHKKLPRPWIVSAAGKLTDDPAEFIGNAGASILPLGGMATGYKGTALGILCETLTNGLSGYGRSKQSGRWSASVFLQILDPEAFGGLDAFEEETRFLVQSCKESKPINPAAPVRLPGERAFGKREEQIRDGLNLSDNMLRYLEENLAKYKLPFPEQIP